MSNEELNKLIMRADDEYDMLKDTVHDQNETIKELRETIKKLEKEIKELKGE